MARDFVRTDRLITALGAAVLVLGALILWRVADMDGFSRETTAERVQRQLAALDPELQLFDLTPGHTPGVACGRAGVPSGASSRRRIDFVARPNRLMTRQDPLRQEFLDQIVRECPDYFSASPTAVRRP